MTDAFEDENEQTVTIDEYIKGVEAEELEADLVLGGDEGNECTYTMGYVKRQAIFSCLTCTQDGNAGVCTACSLSCHDGHEIVELWTKRNFRCDCGNSRFGEFFCKLCPNKDVENTNNSYNHNFKGKYCTCGRPYPDPDAEEQEEMIQCIVCEDWFHEEHLGLDSSNQIPRDDEGEPRYEDFICKACSATCSFLTLYPPKIWAIAGKKVDASISTGKDKDVLEDNPSARVSGNIVNGTSSHDSPVKDDIPANAGSQPLSPGEKSVVGESSEKHIGEHESVKDVNVPISCPLLGDANNSLVVETKPLFLSKGWRQMLCRCEKCLDMYNQRHISYLLDNEDSIAEYEKMAKQKRENKLQQQEGDEMKFFDKLGHVEKMEILNGIADFKDEFRSFLESCDTSKTVTPTDVHQFFENLAKKRRRTQFGNLVSGDKQKFVIVKESGA